MKTCRRLMTLPSHDNQNFSATTKPFSNSPTTPLSLNLSSDRLLHQLDTIPQRILLPSLIVLKLSILNPHPFDIQVMLVLHPIKPSHIGSMMFLAIVLYACDEAVKTATCIATRLFTDSENKAAFQVAKCQSQHRRPREACHRPQDPMRRRSSTH